MDYNTIQQQQETNQMDDALQKVYVQILKNKAFIKSMYDNIFDTIIAVFIGLALVLLSNRFVPPNFMGYEGVQPTLSIAIVLATCAYIAYKAYLKNSKMRK